jgi:hypothetical protein
MSHGLLERAEEGPSAAGRSVQGNANMGSVHLDSLMSTKIVGIAGCSSYSDGPIISC